MGYYTCGLYYRSLHWAWRELQALNTIFHCFFLWTQTDNDNKATPVTGCRMWGKVLMLNVTFFSRNLLSCRTCICPTTSWRQCHRSILHLQVSAWKPLTYITHSCRVLRAAFVLTEQQHLGGETGHLLPLQRHLLPSTQTQRDSTGREPGAALQKPWHLHLSVGAACRPLPLRHQG